MSEHKFNKRIITTVLCTRETDGKKTLVRFPLLGMYGTLIPGRSLQGELNLIKGQQVTVFGDLSYEEYTTRDGEKRQSLTVFVDQVKEPEEGKEPSAWVSLSLRTTKEGYLALTAAGKPWVGTRASMSQGKDRDGKWKPSLFLDVKYFGQDEGDPLPEVLSAKGVKFSAKGFLTEEEYETSEGKKGSKLVLTVRSAEIWNEMLEPVPDFENEPA